MLCSKAVGIIFPYHVLLDGDLTIKSVGKDLPRILDVAKEDLIGNFADSVFSFLEPHVTHWSVKRLFNLEHQDIVLEPMFPSPNLLTRLVLTGSLVITSHKHEECLLILKPDDTSLKTLNLAPPRYGMTGAPSVAVDPLSLRSDHSRGSYGSKSSKQIQKLTKQLKKEQELVESLLPKHAADGLRKGKHVDPVLHEKVTIFFSDIAGFTNMCDKLFPWGKSLWRVPSNIGGRKWTKTHTFFLLSRFIRDHRNVKSLVLHHGSFGQQIWTFQD